MNNILLLKILAFTAISLLLGWLTRASLRDPRSHGFYRFLAWEAMLALLLLNLDHWFHDPFALHQLASWFLLTISVVPVILGFRALQILGHPGCERTDPSLLVIERTTQLVTTGVYHYVRHPMYSSLLLLAWGIFFKLPSWPGLVLGMTATIFLLLTARVEEAENCRFFGPAYREYMRQTNMFIPFSLLSRDHACAGATARQAPQPTGNLAEKSG